MTKHQMVAEPGKHDFLITREFNAPREMVFKAYTEPALIPLWWGLDSTTTIVDKMETKAGGEWRYVQREADGSEYGFHGVYHDITSPERLVYTFEFEECRDTCCSKRSRWKSATARR